MIDKLILGTVQFGLDYGINNTKGKPNKAEVFELLDYAFQSGIQCLDTADAYGNATDLIGDYHQKRPHQFNIITKFNSKNIGLDKSVFPLIEKTLERLQVATLYGYLFHSFDDYQNHKYLLDQLKEIKAKGIIKHLGVSVYTNDQLESVINDDDAIDIIQVPYNLLDNHTQRGALLKLAKEKHKIIHTRSAFLQGLFFKSISTLPTTLLPLKKDLKLIQKTASNQAVDMATLALNYCISNTLINGVLIGVDSIEQLKNNISTLKVSLPKQVINNIDTIAVAHPELLNPTNWS